MLFRLGRLIGQGARSCDRYSSVDRVIRVDLRIVTHDVQSGGHNRILPIKVNAVVYFRVMDPATSN